MDEESLSGQVNNIAKVALLVRSRVLKISLTLQKGRNFYDH